MQLHELKSVAMTGKAGVYLAVVDITDSAGERYEVEYVAKDGDPYGLAPQIFQAITDWSQEGKTIATYTPPPEPTVVELRAAMAPLTARQLRLTLVVHAGITLDDVDTTINQIPNLITRSKTMIEWMYAGRFERTSITVASVAGALGLTDEQVDTLWNIGLTL